MLTSLELVDNFFELARFTSKQHIQDYANRLLTLQVRLRYTREGVRNLKSSKSGTDVSLTPVVSRYIQTQSKSRRGIDRCLCSPCNSIQRTSYAMILSSEKEHQSLVAAPLPFNTNGNKSAIHCRPHVHLVSIIDGRLPAAVLRTSQCLQPRQLRPQRFRRLLRCNWVLKRV